MNDVWKFSGCVDISDKDFVDETADSQKSGGSIFLGFESESLEKVEMPTVAESESDVISKSADLSVVTVGSDLGPKIELLWSFECPMTKGYNVTSIDWNKTNRVSLASAIIVAEAELVDSEEICHKCLLLQSLTGPTVFALHLELCHMVLMIRFFDLQLALTSTVLQHSLYAVHIFL